MKISEIYGKKIGDLSGRTNGYILAISCVENAIEGYICCNERENEFFAESAGVKFKGDCATFTLTGKENKKGYRLKLGGAVYSEQGKYLGRLDDVTLKENKLGVAQVGSKKIPFERLVIGDIIILKNEKPLAEIAAKDMFISALCAN